MYIYIYIYYGGPRGQGPPTAAEDAHGGAAADLTAQNTTTIPKGKKHRKKPWKSFSPGVRATLWVVRIYLPVGPLFEQLLYPEVFDPAGELEAPFRLAARSSGTQ